MLSEPEPRSGHGESKHPALIKNSSVTFVSSVVKKGLLV
jgi:hypothetical protein